MEDKKVLLSVKDLVVKFRVRGRILTAIRGISLDIYENESIAIVGESGSGKSVFTKTFAGMLDGNGFIDNGSLMFDDDETSHTTAPDDNKADQFIAKIHARLNEYSKLEKGADVYKQMIELESENNARYHLSDEESAELDEALNKLVADRTDLYNLMQTYDPHSQKDLIKQAKNDLKAFDFKIEEAKKAAGKREKELSEIAKNDHQYLDSYNARMAELKDRYAALINNEISSETAERNLVIAQEIYLSVNRFNFFAKPKAVKAIMADLKKAMEMGVDLADPDLRTKIFSSTTLRVALVERKDGLYIGKAMLDLANIHYNDDWTKIRGRRIATVFQDPMTSLNPIITIGKQITSIILKHQKVSEVEARARALELMDKVGIPNPEKRFDDYPFQYSGGMRQRIVIAIALSCQPKILICDEPTTALDVTIQAQILKLIKDLQKEFKYTIVFITHDLGVVANIADRVAVLYAGQIVELGTVEEVFYDPRHPYTWALLSSLPQLAERNTKLYSITGTPPSLYNSIVGDAFAPRNPYCLTIDTVKEPPMMKVSETHYAKTWLLDERAPKVEKPDSIKNIHEKLLNAFNI